MSGDAPLAVTVPDHRLDVVVWEDVAEEIARAHGYDRIPGRLPEAALPPFRPDPAEPRHRVRRILAGLGLDEVVLHALIGADDLTRSGYDAADPKLVRVANPLAEQHSIMRPVPYPSMLAALAENVRQRRSDPWLFEVGKTYWMGGSRGPRDGRDRRQRALGGVARHDRAAGTARAAAPGRAEQDADVATLKGLVDALHAALGVPPPAYRPETPDELHPHLHPGRAARIIDATGARLREPGRGASARGRGVGPAGTPGDRVHQSRCAAVHGAVTRCWFSRCPPPSRSIATWRSSVDEATPLGELLRVLRMSAGPLLVEARPFDVYRGPQVGEGRVSYAIALRFQPEKAGDEKSVERAMNKLRGALGHHLGAQIR